MGKLVVSDHPFLVKVGAKSQVCEKKIGKVRRKGERVL